MSQENAVIRACYADVIIRKTRSVAVIQLEIPIEALEDFIAKFGVPLPGQERWVGLALLRPEREAVPVPVPVAPGTEAERALKRAGMLPSDIAFCRWIIGAEVNDSTVVPATPEQAAHILRQALGALSRTELLRDPEMLRRFLDLEDQFLLAAGRRRVAQGAAS